MNTPVLNAENITFSYGSIDVLKDVSIKIYKGDFMAIVGANGSGKSTLLKLCLGILKPQKGKITVLGKELEKFRDWGKIGYIPQKVTSFNQGFPATVEEIVGAGLRTRNRQKIDEVLARVDMLPYKHRLIGKLSGGQQQRIFIAKALISDPEIIFMDEPTVGVDKNSEENFYELMERLNKNNNITLVMVTHDIGAITNKVNRLLCISEGRAVEHNALTDDEAALFLEVYKGKELKQIRHSH